MKFISEDTEKLSPELKEGDDGVWTCMHCGYHHTVLADQEFPEACAKCGIDARAVAI